MSNVSGIGDSGHIPQQPSEQPKTDISLTDAINLFNNLTQELSSVIIGSKLGGKSHG